MANPLMVSVKVLLQALQERPRTRVELQELTGLCNSTITRWVRLLRKSKGSLKPGVIYVESWKRVGDRGNWSEVFAVGTYCDAPKPKALESAEYAKRWRAKKAREARISQRKSGAIVHTAD